jgi:hypothetical protein
MGSKNQKGLIMDPFPDFFVVNSRRRRRIWQAGGKIIQTGLMISE